MLGKILIYLEITEIRIIKPKMSIVIKFYLLQLLNNKKVKLSCVSMDPSGCVENLYFYVLFAGLKL